MNIIIRLLLLKEQMHPHKLMNLLLKVWAGALLLLAIVGLVGVIIHMIANPSSVTNATFGIFDHI
jgi:hypothetical protein